MHLFPFAWISYSLTSSPTPSIKRTLILTPLALTATIQIPPSSTLAVVIPIATTGTTDYTTITSCAESIAGCPATATASQEPVQTTNAVSVLSSALATFPSSLLPKTTYSFDFTTRTSVVGSGSTSASTSATSSGGLQTSTIVVSGQQTVTLLSSGGSLISLSATSATSTSAAPNPTTTLSTTSTKSSTLTTLITTSTSTSTSSSSSASSSASESSITSSSTTQTSTRQSTTTHSGTATNTVKPATTTAAPPINAAVRDSSPSAILGMLVLFGVTVGLLV
ncbi:uncharacterized protein M437DRAFT_77250 [Aureobasidium melanogenum CBS 110374]|uniref:Uncharacterized protein n=1 Tax=Aureobasidium melanogenum (strain CBS 110374) TaxID=1043003 RepID=A0A074VN39_AURM1|nr:uncharacterized protein M437DRAFT_77250 [Aureobasidium melanogenum CBS 110374]KEQ60534.1 hypothetical protein M437DRAFT_77250 [Aureobasidium melanogenum CBS 110374]